MKQTEEKGTSFDALNERGVSLIELFFTFLLFSSMAFVIFASMQSSRVIFSQNVDEVDAQSNLRRTMQIVKRDLREAQQGIDPMGEACDSTNPDGVCIQSNPVILAFKVPEQTVGPQTTYKTIRYTYDSNADTLTRDEIPSTGLPATSTEIAGKLVTGITVTQNVAQTVDVALSSGTKTLSSEVVLRNQAA